ncbi:MAG TPA: YjgN family protein [Polyangiaceae bacterium]|nr:YjgN family protein [Polyangiaceae bacterium]
MFAEEAAGASGVTVGAGGPTGSGAGGGSRELPFQFTGNASEYFGIWIVNVLLTVLTLGIYSAWAKVRTKNYFYRNTRLDGSTFVYLADPLKILKGRMLVLAFFGVSFLTQFISPILNLALVLVLVLSTPALLVLSTAFNARNTAYRNLRFGFRGEISSAYWIFLKGGLVYLFTLGIGFPYFQQRLTRFILGGHRYGTTPFSFQARVGQFYRCYLIAGLFAAPGLIFFIASMSSMAKGLGGRPPSAENLAGLFVALPLFYAGILLATGYLQAQLANLVLSHVSIGPHRLNAKLEVWPVIWLLFSNAIAVVVSLGLLMPWAKVRFTRYRLSRLTLVAQGELDAQVDREFSERGALGDAADDLGAFDFDLGF